MIKDKNCVRSHIFIYLHRRWRSGTKNNQCFRLIKFICDASTIKN